MDLSIAKNLTEDQIKTAIAGLKEELLIRIEQADPNNDNIANCVFCEIDYLKSNKARHNKTKKHVKAVEYYDSLKRISRSKTLIARAGQY